jgi:hypothetical protein
MTDLIPEARSREETKMRYLMFVKMAPDAGQAPPALFEAMGKEIETMFADGTMLDAGGLGGPDQTIELRLAGGEITNVDGPYAEAKEVVGGYSMVEVRSEAEAVENARRVLELHKQHWPGWEGAVEIHPVFRGE